jgi:lipopolysaccharide export system permease protein
MEEVPVKRIDYYIGRTIIITTLFSVFLLLAIDLFFILIAELTELGHGDYGMPQIFVYLLWTTPHHIFKMFPMASLLGAVLGLGFLANRHELTSMRAAGISVAQIMWSVLRTALVMVILVTAMGEWVVPWTQHKADTEKAFAESQGQALKTLQGTWLRNGPEFIHIQSALPQGVLQGITIYAFDSHYHLTAIRQAVRAVYDSPQHFQLQDVAETRFAHNKAIAQHIAVLPWQVFFNLKFLNTLSVAPDDLSLSGLAHYINYLKTNHLESAPYVLTLWRKLAQPLATLIMIWLGIAAVFGPLRSAKMGLRMITGILLGFSFYLVNQLMGTLSLAYHFSPIVGALLPLAVFAGLAMALMRRIR